MKNWIRFIYIAICLLVGIVSLRATTIANTIDLTSESLNTHDHFIIKWEENVVNDNEYNKYQIYVDLPQQHSISNTNGKREKTSENQLKLIEETTIFPGISKHTIDDSIKNNYVFYVAPMQIFIKISDSSYYDILANEEIPSELFEEIVNDRLIHKQKELVKSHFFQPRDYTSPTLYSYFIKTETYFSEFYAIKTANNIITVIDPLNHDQWSNVYHPDHFFLYE
ncbi:hypothetical protein BHU72_02150 [Desulfuribacillus stibiiarsenatis]|uniref:Uncharacterized protein n=1 Tax=Desulfuribacillus stibiiarsenatis TaxID=1390249 RepID=A0A1E5L637_9FIRM|nr:hypothetical protein [Desulfuribacillus stibiiarsenatis]OEH85622.1 hypothetical protein BHU72_02150 [Desulfuribacillus stibiiarsenatis]